MIDRHTEADGLQSVIADHPFVPGGEKFRITLCIGLIEIDGSLDRIELFARAGPTRPCTGPSRMAATG
jgi:hypothetical protein